MPEVKIYEHSAQQRFPCSSAFQMRVRRKSGLRPVIVETIHEVPFIPPLTNPGTAGGAPRWVFKSPVRNAGDFGSVSIYRASNQRPLAGEAACLSTILTRVLTTFRCSAVQSRFWADRSVHVHDRKCK